MDSTVIFKTLHFLLKAECHLLHKCFTLYSELTARFRQSNANLKEPKKIQWGFFFTLTKGHYVNIFLHIFH